MFCSGCGTQLPDDANFCVKCGKPQKPGVQTEEPKWETCEISDDAESSGINRLFSVRTYYWAAAIGSKGLYNAGESETFDAAPRVEGRKQTSAHANLIRKLVADGWEPTGMRGENWYSDRFRRKEKT